MYTNNDPTCSSLKTNRGPNIVVKLVSIFMYNYGKVTFIFVFN